MIRRNEINAAREGEKHRLILLLLKITRSKPTSFAGRGIVKAPEFFRRAHRGARE